MSGFVHQACVYGSDEEFLSMAVPFVTAGTSAGEPVVVVATPHNIDLLRRAQPDDRVEYIDCFSWYTAPGRTTLNYFDRVRSHTGPGRMRVIGEVVWEGRTPAQTAAWKRYESTLNVTFADTASWIVCPYDTRTLPADVIADARRTHPAHLGGSEITSCAEYVDPGTFVGEAVTMSQPPADAAVLPYALDLHSVRRFVTIWSTVHGLHGERGDSLAAAATEVAAYLSEMGDGRLSVRLWSQSRTVTCDVHAPSVDIADPFVGYRPPALDPHPGDGLWLARYLCDHLDIRCDSSGSTIRLEMMEDL